MEVSSVENDPGARPAWPGRSAQLDRDFADFFAANWAPSYRLAGLMGAEDPENVAQEALARLHGRFDKLQGAGGAERYLRATICNLSRSAWRRRKVAERALPKLAGPHTGEPMVGADDADELMSALRKLSSRQRQVIVLRFWMELSEQEIADTIGISSGSVKVHASRGMQTLRKVLDQ